MRMMSKIFQRVFVLILLGSTIACTPPTALRQHPDFDESRKMIERVVVLPPDVNVERIMFTGENETLDSEEGSYPITLASKAQEILHNNGYATCKVDLLELSAGDPDLAFQVEQIKNAYEAASKELFEQTVAEDDYKRFRVTLGPIVNEVADLADADALLLISFEGVTKSDGQMNKEIAANVLLSALSGVYYHPIRSASFVEVALIDAATGDVLWVNTYAQEGLTTGILTGALDGVPDGIMGDLIAAEQAAADAERESKYEQWKIEHADIDAADIPASWQTD